MHTQSLRMSVQDELAYTLKHYTTDNPTIYGPDVGCTAWEPIIHIGQDGNVNCEMKIYFQGAFKNPPTYEGIKSVIKTWWYKNWGETLGQHIWVRMEHFKLKMITKPKNRRPKGVISISFSFWRGCNGKISPSNVFQENKKHEISDTAMEHHLYAFVRAVLPTIKNTLGLDDFKTAPYGLHITQNMLGKDVLMFSAVVPATEFLDCKQKAIRKSVFEVVHARNNGLRDMKAERKLCWTLSQQFNDKIGVSTFHITFWYEKDEEEEEK